MKRTRRGRSTRSHVLELTLVAMALVAFYLWLTNGGPTALGQWFAGRMGAP